MLNHKISPPFGRRNDTALEHCLPCEAQFIERSMVISSLILLSQRRGEILIIDTSEIRSQRSKINRDSNDFGPSLHEINASLH
jgi:hypothetical protein